MLDKTKTGRSSTDVVQEEIRFLVCGRGIDSFNLPCESWKEKSQTLSR